MGFFFIFYSNTRTGKNGDVDEELAAESKTATSADEDGSVSLCIWFVLHL